jgi:trimethylamine:corrinoid methyltransferase-like protein
MATNCRDPSEIRLLIDGTDPFIGAMAPRVEAGALDPLCQRCIEALCGIALVPTAATGRQAAKETLGKCADSPFDLR